MAMVAVPRCRASTGLVEENEGANLTMNAAEVYKGSDGQVTMAYYSELSKRGPMGQVAVALFRAQKRSTAAKNYRGRRFKGAAYDVKNWSLQQASELLEKYGAELGIAWGWKQDPNTPGYEWVLYVDLPTGQVSFHSAVRYSKKDYAGEWDGKKLSTERIIAFCDSASMQEEHEVRVQK